VGTKIINGQFHDKHVYEEMPKSYITKKFANEHKISLECTLKCLIQLLVTLLLVIKTYLQYITYKEVG